MNEKPEESLAIQDVANELELRKLELAQKDKQAQAELAFKEKELQLKLKGEKHNIWTSPFLITVLTVTAGLLGSAVGGVLQGYWTTELERQKFESSLIAKAVETNDQNVAASRLKFLIDTKIIQTLKKEDVQPFIDNPTTIPLTVIGRGSRGLEVQKFQSRMVELGYLDAETANSSDSNFGPKSEAVIRLFQKNNKLPETGFVDEETNKKLYGDKSKLVNPEGNPYK